MCGACECVFLAWMQGHGQPDQQRSYCLSFVFRWFPSNTFLICLFEAMAAAGLGLRKSGKFRAKSSNQSWSPNFEQVAENESHKLVLVIDCICRVKRQF